MRPHKLLEAETLSHAKQAQLDAYLESADGAAHAQFHDLLQSELSMPKTPKLSLSIEELAISVRKRTRHKANLRRAGQAVGSMVMIFSVCAAVLLWFTPPPRIEPVAFQTQPVTQQVDLWAMSPQMPLGEFAVFDQTIESVQAQIALPLTVPTQLPIGFELIGAAYNDVEISADIAFSESAASRVWIISQRDKFHRDDLLNTVVGPRLSPTMYQQPFIQLANTKAAVSNYTFGDDRDELFQTVEWETDDRQLRVTIYVVEYAPIEQIAEIITQFGILPTR